MRVDKTTVRRLGLIAMVSLLGLALPVLAAPKKQYPWAKAPGAIAGTWKACADFGKTVITFQVAGNKATGTLGKPYDWAKKRGYKAGEAILELTVDDYGDWVGTLLWKSVAGAKRKDPIRLVVKGDTMDASMTTDKCYKGMTRTR